MTEPLRIVCFKWRSRRPYRSTFTSEHVNVLRRMVRRNLSLDHEFCCVTDDPHGLDRGVRRIPLWRHYEDLASPLGNAGPSCYRRLWMFSSEAEEIFGPRFACLDLDTVVVGDLTPLLSRTEDFVIWGDTHPRTFYNGSFWLLRAGTRSRVWDEFDPVRSPTLARAAGHLGSDQAWISYCLGSREATWGRRDGVYSYRVHVEPSGNRLPDNARVVFFHGKVDPWSSEAQSVEWIRHCWR